MYPPRARTLNIQYPTRLWLLLGLFLLLAAFIAAPVHADDQAAPSADPAKNPDLVTLFDRTSFSLVPSAAVYTDPNGTLTSTVALNRYLAGDRPHSNSNDLIIPDQRHTPFWLIIPISNQTDRADWALDFGTRLMGRMALFNNLFIYDQASKRVLFNSSAQDNGVHIGELPTSSVVPITLPVRQSTLLMIYLQPTNLNGISTVLNLRPATGPDATAKPIWTQPELFFLMIAGLTGVFFALAMFSQRIWIAAIPLYLWSLSLTSLFFPENAFSTPGDFTAMLPLYNVPVQGICLIFCAWLLLREAGSSRLSPIYASVGIAIGTIMIAFITLQPEMWVQNPSIKLFAGHITFPIITAMIAMSQIRKGYLSGIHVLMIAMLHLLASLMNYASEFQIGPVQSFFMYNSKLYMILPQALLFIAAMRTLNIIGSTGERTIGTRRSTQDEGQLAKLRQVKENFDYNNLLKVIDHERKQLAEARTREAERTEEMRRAKNIADEANRAKSAFLAVISHEIRTPMTGIMGMVKVLLDSTMSKEQHDYVGTIKESGNAMMSLLNDILDFEKIESGKMQLEQIDFDLHRLVQSIATLMHGHATTKGIALKIDIDESVPQFVIGDMTRLRQVMLNLVGNAIKFTSTGSVTIRLSATLSQNQNSNDTGKKFQVYFAVQDTGIGISFEAQKNIFNPFAQADKTISRKFGGTGLGLAISKRLIEAMGSQININSRENEGTTFFFTLSLPEGRAELAENTVDAPTPITETSSQGSDNSSSTTTAPANENALRVLVVEDNEITRRVLRTLLEQQGHRAVTAESGEAAITLLGQDTRFDLILTDVQMTGMSGHDLARHIRQNTNTQLANIPIIALTGNVDEKDIRECLDAGMNAHLAKPIDPDQFEQLLKTYGTPSAMPAADFASMSVSPLVAMAEEMNRPVHTAVPIQTDQNIMEQSPAPEPLPDVDIFQSDMLETLKESLGADQLGDILKGLFDKADELVAALNDAPMPYKFDEINARAHELKGMCGNFGLMALSQLAMQIEKQAKAQQPNGLDTLIQKLPASFEAGRRAIDEWLRS